MKNKGNVKTLVFSLGLAAMTLTANNLNAQNGGGLFGRGATSSEYAASSSEESLLQRDAIDFKCTGSGIQNGNFEVVTPLGGGIAILLVAGLGYVALKKKEDEQ
jgi:hypothetical protein